MASHSDSSANNECLRSGQALADALVALVQPGVEADENQALARSDSGHTEPIFKKCNPTKTQTDFTRRKSHIEMFAAVPMFNDDQGESSRLDECDSTTVPTPSRYMSVDDIREEDEDEGDEVSSDENDSKNDTGTDTDMKQSSVRNQGTGRMLSHAHSTDSTESCVSETGSDGEGASRSLLTMQRARLNCSINSTAIDKIDAVPGDQVKDDQSGATYTNVGSESELNMSSTQRRLRSPSNPRPISPTDFTSRFYTPPHPGNSTALNPGSHAYTKPPHPHSRGARSVSVNSSSGAFRVHNSLNKGWAGKLMYRSGRKRGVSVGSACGDGATTLYPVASTVNSRRSSLSNSPGQSPKSRSRGHSISGGVGLLLQHLGAAMKGADGKRIPTKGKITGHTSDDSDGIKALSAKSSGGSLSSTSAMSAGSSTGTDASDDTEKMKLRPMPSDTTKKTLSHTFASIRRAGMRNSSSSATSSMATSGPGSLQNVKCIASDSLTINSDTARLGASFDSLDAICDSSDSVCMTPNLGYWEEIRASNEPRVWFDISEEEDEGEDGILSAASVNRLVEHYIRHFGSCSTFQVASYNFPKIMLRSHLWFLTSPGLLRKLTEIYDVPKDYPEEKRVRNAICQGLRFWMQQQILDFTVPNFFKNKELVSVEPEMQTELDNLYKAMENHGEDTGTLRRTLEKQLQQQFDKKQALLSQPTPEEADYKPEFGALPLDLVAEQLTLIEFDYFHAIQMRDLKAKLWTDELEQCPIMKMIIHFNQVSTWVIHTILSADTIENGARTIDKFRTLAASLRTQSNYNTMMAIDGALQHTAVERLHKTFHELSDRKTKALQELKDFTTPMLNYKRYREVQRQQIGFCIPYIGLYLRDMLHTEDALKSWTGSGQIVNFKKMRRIAESAWEIYRCQEIVPSHVQLPKLNTIIKGFLGNEVKEEELYAMSYKIMPRDSHSSSKTTKSKQTTQPIITISQTIVNKGRSRRPKKISIHSQSSVHISTHPTTPHSEAVVNLIVELLMQRWGEEKNETIPDTNLDDMTDALTELKDHDPLCKDIARPVTKQQLGILIESLWGQAAHVPKKKFATLGKSRSKVKSHRIIQQLWEYLHVEEQMAVREELYPIEARDRDSAMDLRSILNSPKASRMRRRGFSNSVEAQATMKIRRPSADTVTSNGSKSGVNSRKMSLASLAGKLDRKEKDEGKDLPSQVETGTA